MLPQTGGTIISQSTGQFKTVSPNSQTLSPQTGTISTSQSTGQFKIVSSISQTLLPQTGGISIARTVIFFETMVRNLGVKVRSVSS